MRDDQEREWGKSMSEIAFGRDLTGVPWDQLTPAEKKAINELAQSPVTSRMLESLIRVSGWPEAEVYADLAAAHGYVKSVDLGAVSCSVVIPAGHQNRKARRAQRAAQKRAAWHAFKASQRQSVTLQQVIDEYEKEQAGQWP